MTTRALLFLTVAMAFAGAALAVANQTTSPSSQRTASSWTPPRTPWGDPDIQGTYTNKDENGTPFERPAELAGKSLSDFSDKDMVALRKLRQEQAKLRAPSIGGSEEEDTGAGPSHWYEHLEANNSQPWLVVEPADGKIPALTGDAQKRAAERQSLRRGRGPADSWTDRSLYDRCLTRGLPGSMLPAIYGNAYDITQGPGFVAIRYEMIHEARVVPLDGKARLSDANRQYMGDARGRWDGNTLVIETTNFTDRTAYRGSSTNLKIVERFTPVNANTLRWEVRFEDSSTWERPWAIAMPLKRDNTSQVFEYACHEGNRGLENILSAARSEEKKAKP